MGALSRTAPWWLVAACALAATGVATGAQLAISSAGAPVVAGGDSIATATALPVETRVANTNRRPEYWRVDLGLADGFGSLEYVAREVIKAEEIVDFSQKENIAEKFARRLGAGAASALAELALRNSSGSMR